MTSGDPPLHIRLLGELQLVRDGQIVALPASRKTRALLGYLIATGQPHRRERLCDLLWDGPDDPRAELRWSVSKLRPLVNADGTTRLVTDRERIGFQPLGAAIDLDSVRSMLGSDVTTTPTAALREAAALFRGEFLDGLDLPICYRFQEWCMAEREAVSRLRRTILASLVARLEDDPEEALTYARALVSADPLAEAGHAAIVRLLARLGRKREALAQYEHAQRLLEAELGLSPAAELETAYQDLKPVVASRPAATVPARPERESVRAIETSSPRTSFVGRRDERTLVDRLIAATIANQQASLLLVLGEPGIGKSHLLDYMRQRMVASGGAVYGARAFAAETARPYGIWVDLLRTILRDRVDTHEFQELSLLLPEISAPPDDPGDRSRLFDAVVELMVTLAAERPLVITLDDVQWVDEASSALLHYLARRLDQPARLFVACAARQGEIADNLSVAGVFRSLEREGRLRSVSLSTLDADETRDLVHTVDHALDPAQIYSQSQGNPLFTLELTRAHLRGEVGPGRTVDVVIEDQLDRLRDRSRDLLVWAAALERGFTLEGLARVAGFDTPELLDALQELERRGIVRPAGEETYEFVHDVIRQAAYRGLSQPRRTLIHRQIARALLAASEADAALAGDAAHHAALGNDDAMAARACVVAGERALKLFANSEANAFAQRGEHHLAHLPLGPMRVESTIAFLKIRILAATGPGMRPLPPLADDLTRAVSSAEAFGLHEAAATGHYLLSVVYQEAGDLPQAERSTLRAAQMGRTTDAATQVHQLANTARCLLELETQIGRSRLLVEEATAIANALAIERCELHWGHGLLQRWDGQPAAAVAAIERALWLAQHAEDRWREYKCLTWLAMLAFERGHFAETLSRCDELMTVAGRLGDDSTPFVLTLRVLAEISASGGAIDTALTDALRRLRAVDDKSYLAYVLNTAAALHLARGDALTAAEQAREALDLATVMRRHNEGAISVALLARSGETESLLESHRLQHESANRDRFSARARAALAEAAGMTQPVPTMIPTLSSQT